jgi:ubiquinone/menaquinone biosynthesis C-methylase UbiE
VAASNQLYELWASESELLAALQQSLDPRGTEWLFELFASLGPRPGETLVDIGCRDAKHTIRLVKEHGLRAHALDPFPLHVERARAAVDAAGADVSVLEAAIEALPLNAESVDWIWCRDVLVHTDVRRGLAECARVLRRGGSMLAYVTLATDQLEPRERKQLVDAMTLQSFDADVIEAAARDAGLVQTQSDALRGEWRERMLEDGTWNANESLLAIARVDRRRDELAARFGDAAVAASRAADVWGIYQLLGKTCPTAYVWEKPR